ncbi:hypothetical protein BHE74_00039318, partial [Ensete ventricosum]
SERSKSGGGWTPALTLALAAALRTPTMAGTRLIPGAGGRLFSSSSTERAFFCTSVCLYYVPSLPRSRRHNTHPTPNATKIVRRLATSPTTLSS